MNYVNCNKEDLEKEYAALVAEYEEVKGKGLKLNMARGKPCEDQLNLSRPLLEQEHPFCWNRLKGYHT